MTDSSVDIWKTIGVWATQISANPNAALDTQFTIVSTGTAPADSAAALLRIDSGEADRAIALNKLELAANTSENKSTQSQRKRFLNLSATDRKNLAKCVVVFDNAPNITDVRSEIEEICWSAAPEGQISTLVDYLEGWWTGIVIKALLAGGSIPVQLVRQKIDELRESFKFENLPLDESLTEKLIDLPESENRLFIKQLRVLKVGEQTILGAIRDYYRSSEARSKWARENLLLDDDAGKYDTALVDRWQRTFNQKLDQHSPLTTDDNKRKCGQAVFYWANSTPFPLRNRTEQWLCAGSYHLLAERLLVGWHPDHAKLFSTGGSSAKVA